MKHKFKNIYKELRSRFDFWLELRSYDKQKSGEDLWVTRNENDKDDKEI